MTCGFVELEAHAKFIISAILCSHLFLAGRQAILRDEKINIGYYCKLFNQFFFLPTLFVGDSDFYF